jgi:ubiquinone/menaquinone biosynthesis C-methylase UbiE
MRRRWLEINQQLYRNQKIVDYYSGQEKLLSSEEAILKMVSEEISGRRLLDIGVGGGRTTEFLTRISEDYVGIDYSEEMVERTRRRFPKADVRHMDARNLGVFEDSSFDFILFSFNGLDYANHQDRKTILSSACRALDPTGLFAFSTHNLASLKEDRLRPRRPRFRASPWGCLSEIKDFAVASFNHIKYARHEVWGEEFAIVNDTTHRCSLLTYYVSIDEQLKQLREAGFAGDIVCFDQAGEPTTTDRDSPWIHFLARKTSPSRLR